MSCSTATDYGAYRWITYRGLDVILGTDALTSFLFHGLTLDSRRHRVYRHPE